MSSSSVKPLSRAKSSNSCDADHSDNNSETTTSWYPNESGTVSPRSEASSTTSTNAGGVNMTHEKMNKMMNASFGKGKSPLKQRKLSSSSATSASIGKDKNRQSTDSPNSSYDQKYEWEKEIEKMYTEKTNAQDLEQLRKDYSLYGSLLFVSLSFYLVSSYGQPWIAQQLGERSTLKPYKTFDEFYPFYLTQHTDGACRTLHFIGTTIIMFMMLKSIDIFLSMIPAALIGHALSTCTVDIDNGIIEGGVMVVIFIVTNIKISHVIYRPFLVLLVGYGFAWVGHYFFEQNQPATFIYPLYSLMGDMKMWFQLFTMQIDFEA